jgi:hypothetical protein
METEFGNEVEFGGIPGDEGGVVEGEEDYAAAGAEAVDYVLGARRLPPRRPMATRRPQQKKLVSFVYEGGIQGPAIAAGPAGPFNATFHCNGPRQILDWITGNPLGAAGAEQWSFSSILQGDTPMNFGSGVIYGSSHAAGVQGRFVHYPTAQQGTDIVWVHNLLLAAGATLVLNLKVKGWRRAG